MEKWKTNNRFPTFPRALRDDERGWGWNQNKTVGPPFDQPDWVDIDTKEAFIRGNTAHSDSGISGSCRIGNESPFQAHSALELNLVFRLISGLENAVTELSNA
jgi:hypothetical protein